jgi:hypothetical protein
MDGRDIGIGGYPYIIDVIHGGYWSIATFYMEITVLARERYHGLFYFPFPGQLYR